ncbi:MAG: FAD-dependent oxidoreductase, partial [Pseudomonadota bacterium]
RRQATTAHSFGLDMQLLTPHEAQQLWPLMNIDDVIGAAFLPTDGQANPSDITQALAKGARQQGAQIIENTHVRDIQINNGKITAVVVSSEDGRNEQTIGCEKIVCCCGQWSRAFAARYNVNIPLVSVQHQYLITDTIAGMPAQLPTLRDPDRLTYYKEEVGGLVMGGYEPNPKAWAQQGIPERFNFQLLDSDYDHFAPMLEQAGIRVPAMNNAGIKQLINGPESFTPDGNFILGQAPELDNFFVGAGFNAFGIASGGGAGMALAEWVVNGAPPFDLWPVDIRRFGAPHRDTRWVTERTLESYAKHYTIAWPAEEFGSARPVRRSPLYATLQQQGACFGEKLGWERPNWFADISAGEKPVDTYSFDKPGWFNAVAREHRAVREAAAIFDQSSFAKYRIEGKDATAALQWLSSNNIDKPVGTVVYTQLLNVNGGIECDLTVARVAETEYYLVTGTGFATHDLDWIKRNMPAHLQVSVADVTSAYGVLSLMGPQSRVILEQATGLSLSDEQVPFGSVHDIPLAGTLMRAIRISYVGELGWELHIPIECMQSVYDVLMDAGRTHGLINAGYRAIESCRLEKGFLAWGADIGPDHTPVEAGLTWAVNTDLDFKGKSAILEQLAGGVKKRMAMFTVNDPQVVLLGRETIYRNGERVGWLSSGGFAYTLGKAVGLGYIRSNTSIDAHYVNSGTYQLEVASDMIDASLYNNP